MAGAGGSLRDQCLMPDTLLAVDGTTFLLTDRSGDVRGGSQGLFVRDARYLSRWRLLVDGLPPEPLTAHHVDPYSGLVVLMNADGGSLPPNAVSIFRRRVVGGGMEEEIELHNHLSRAVTFDLGLEVAADFLDLFEVKARHFVNPGDNVFTEPASESAPTPGKVSGRAGETLVFAQRRGAYRGRVAVGANPEPAVNERGMTWTVTMGPGERFSVSLAVTLRLQGEDVAPRHHLADFGRAAPGDDGQRQRQAAALSTDWAGLQSTHARAMADLATLVIDEPDLAQGLPAAGLPWFMTVFGRDTLVTAYQLLPGSPEMGWVAIDTLARLQATEVDPSRDAEPGKIVHELRRGPSAVNGGYFPYYGTVDAPMLFIILLHELWRWSGDEERARRYRPHAEAALQWMKTGGDLDQDGFIEWHRRCPKGLENQAWKDSWDAFRGRDGALAVGPIASSEVQGYAYDAYVRAAELAAGPWGDAGQAVILRERATQLHRRFNAAFWSDQRNGYYHLALDGRKLPVDSLASNMGHLLWSGIVTPERAPAVARQLLSASMFSGWGIRTMADTEGGFNPISYHCGTVWPHDNSLAVAGLHRYGFHDEANRVMVAIVTAAAHFDHRLPEVFAGYGQEVAPFPVEYPTASSPQAWSCGAPALMLRAALGLEPAPGGEGVVVDPHLPKEARRLRLTGLTAFGRGFSVEVSDGRATTSPA
ncbi:MAG: glycogen debranching N-terminal domain-containing protein [Candidatus Dormibacteria bacterium]